MGEIIVAGKAFLCDHPVINFRQSPARKYPGSQPWNATRKECIRISHGSHTGIFSRNRNKPNRYGHRPGIGASMHSTNWNWSPDALKQCQNLVTQFVVHYDGCLDSRMCMEVLHNERGYSCHFLIDNDGTIFQTLDLALMGFQSKGFNSFTAGVEFANRGDVLRHPDQNPYYGRRLPAFKKRDSQIDICKIHGHVLQVYRFTEAQLRAFEELARSLRFALPNLPIDYPRDIKNPGQPSFDLIRNAKEYKGYIGHYHQTKRKVDPGPFDFRGFCNKVRGSICFPMWTGKTKNSAKAPWAPLNDWSALNRRVDGLFANNESGPGGFFPVGPTELNTEKGLRLWHGGVHLQGKKDQLIFAPIAGTIVAARMGGTSINGSTNFVLIQHDLTFAKVPFYTLFFHLQDEWDTTTSNTWIDGDSWKNAKTSPGQVILLHHALKAGDVVGRLGHVGPPGKKTYQVHFETFSPANILPYEDQLQWLYVSGITHGRFASDEDINPKIDTDDDQRFSRRELLNYFSKSPDRPRMRGHYILSETEWKGPVAAWVEAFSLIDDFKGTNKREIENLVQQQIAPTLWWDAKITDPDGNASTLATVLGLPKDGIVYHYHPIQLLDFFAKKLAAAKHDRTTSKFKLSDTEPSPDFITDDAASDADAGNDEENWLATKEELADNVKPTPPQPSLEDLIKGFDE